jgi:hypothetical protein
MKGIAHFAAGVAAASCFPGAVAAGARGNPLYFVLGGVFGLLPDTLDFKFYRFFYRHDVEVTPDPNRPDPTLIAEAVAGAVRRTHETGRPLRVKLNTVRLGPDLWQRYTVAFDVAARRVCVRYGPAVDTGRQPVRDRSCTVREACAPLPCAIALDYEAVTEVDIFDGPLFQMEKAADGRVRPRFIPWHREWSHSFPVGLLLALLGGVLFGPLAGAVILGAVAAHILADQMGFMGSNLFFPFTRHRCRGLAWMHSGQGMPNFVAVWLACVVVFWNLCQFTPDRACSLNPLQYVFFAAVVPVLGLRLARYAVRRLGGGADGCAIEEDV